ncbi:unnamed protein product [Adineta steineri]|uniref:Uncharacterized protein n=1 Tax=Adineta steineri TaxID=433720 RepID=A0A818SPF4_9BILA|nr:unnamed protein product [Adineta steineri]CAF3672929.1 unnamed protein product [Adineta steineri]
MSDKNETNNLHENSDTIEEKRRKNMIDNQKFLDSLKLFNVRDDLKSTVNSVTTEKKPPRKKHTRKDKLDPSEIRRSSRIQSMPHSNYNDQSYENDEDFIVSTDESSNGENEDEDELASVFTTKIDKDWKPSYSVKQPAVKHLRPVRTAAKTVSGGVKIYHPNVGLQASMVQSTDHSQNFYRAKKINVAISSSSEDD